MSIFNSLQSLLAQTPEVPAPEEIAQTWQQKLSALSSLSFQQFMEQAISAILHGAVKIAIALAVFFIGKWIINRIYHGWCPESPPKQFPQKNRKDPGT